MKQSSRCGVQPTRYFLVALVCTAMTFATSLGIAAEPSVAEPSDAGRFYFFAGPSHVEATGRVWSESEVKVAAAQAESVVRMAAQRIDQALGASNSSYFLNSGDEYIRTEWPLAAAEQVPFAFARQAIEFKNLAVSPYATCGKAGKAVGDWYHFYRSNLSNGYDLASLKRTQSAKEVAATLWTTLGDCKKSL